MIVDTKSHRIAQICRKCHRVSNYIKYPVASNLRGRYCAISVTRKNRQMSI